MAGTASPIASSRRVGAVLTGAIVVLALTSAAIHLRLGALLFTLNALGYTVLAAAVGASAVSSHPLVVRFRWLPRVALIGYALASIVAWMVVGGFYVLGYFTKAVELVLIALVMIDLYRLYGGPRGLVQQVKESVAETATSLRR